MAPSKSEQLSVVLSGAPIFLFAVDRGNLFTVLEGRALQSLNVVKKDLIGKGFYELFPGISEMRALLTAAFEGSSGVLKHSLKGRPFETRLTPLLDGHGTVTGIIGVATDCSAQNDEKGEDGPKSAHSEVGDIVPQTNTSTLITSEFVTRVSHELRSPLNSILGFAGVLLNTNDGHLGEQDKLYLKRIEGNAAHLLQVVRQVLDLSAIKNGKLPLTISEVHLGQFLEEIAGELEGLSRPAEVRLIVDVPKELISLKTDRVKLKQILINLIGNALKYTEKGSVSVRVVSDKKHQPTRIDVIDSGPGIGADKLGRIFEPFERVHKAGEEEKGTGLGLTICRSLSGLLGYRIGVESEEGRGSTFSLHIPHAKP